MNKLAYETAMYSAFFDELEKLGYDLSEMEKEAILGAVGKGIGKAVQALKPASSKMTAALAKPGATAVGTSPAAMQAASRARQLNPAMRAPAPTVKMTRPSAASAAQPSMRPVGGSSMIWGT